MKTAAAPWLPRCHWVKWLYYLFALSLVLLHQQARSQLEVASTKQVFFAAEEGTVRIACEQTCHSDANINQQWNLQVPWYRNFGFTDLTNVQLREKVEAHFGIQIRLGEDKAPCTNGSTHSIFYLDIEDVNASLNHAVVLCGVDNTSIQPSEKTFLPFAIYLVVNRIDAVVMATSVVNYVSESGVRIECVHTCNGARAELQHLWTMRTFGYRELGAMELHNSTVRAQVVSELGIEITLTSDVSGCSGNGTSSFYLDIVGTSDVLQHSLVSCGVKLSPDSAEVYSQRDSYIVINETVIHAARLINYANESGGVTIECTHTCSGATDPQYLWTIRMLGYEPLEALQLHDDDIRTQVETKLGINISLDSDASDCEEEDGMRSFYLIISGLNDKLQHSAVSCGVKLNQNSSELYSTRDSYIVIEKAPAMTTPPPTTTHPHITMTKSSTTAEKPAIPGCPGVASPAAVAAPSALVGLVIGVVLGTIVTGIVFHFKTIGRKKVLNTIPEDLVASTEKTVYSNDPDNF